VFQPAGPVFEPLVSGMRRSWTLIRIAYACVAAAVAVPAAAGSASASTDQEAILQDDPKFVFPKSRDELERNLERAKAIGVDRIRVSVFWDLFGPAPKSMDRPDFAHEETDPRSYRSDAWQRYDLVIKTATAKGIGVLLNLTGPAPHWAAEPRGRGFNKNRVVNPDVQAFRDWVAAVGTRYSGSYADPEPAAAQLPSLLGGENRQAPPLPAVDHWSTWNEPNFPSWLYPQWRRVGRRLIPASPRRYRQLANAAYGALQETGHASDTFLLGETASGGERKLKGGVQPLIFLRELYCLNGRYVPYGGRQARLRGCPTTSGARASFVASNPGLFAARGWAHHPYNRYFRPNWRHPERNSVTMGDLRRMISALDRVFFRWRSSGQVPVWITEHGYQTDPPDPTARVRPFRAGTYIAEADFIAYRNPRVASTAQFLLFDDAPRRKYSRRMPRIYWGTWQSGLFTEFGNAKPALDFFRHPIALGGRRGRSVRVWGQYRPADAGAGPAARIEFQGFGQRDWRTLQSVSVQSARAFLDQRVAVPRSGRLRIVWTDSATGAEHPSPQLRIRVR
jgi:hypothetical protein